ARAIWSRVAAERALTTALPLSNSMVTPSSIDRKEAPQGSAAADAASGPGSVPGLGTALALAPAASGEGASSQMKRSVTRVTGRAGPKTVGAVAVLTASIAMVAASREGGAPARTTHWPETTGAAHAAPTLSRAWRAAVAAVC